MTKVLVAIPKLIFRLQRNISVLYMPLDARKGLYYSLFFVFLARFRGYHIVAHHHVYTYINKYDKRVALINRLIGKDGAHVVHCDQMKIDYIRTYPTKATFLILPPTVVLENRLSKYRRRKNPSLTIGFLSNLTEEKGIDAALETFEILSVNGRNIRMLLAGPIIQKHIEKKIRDTSLRWPGMFYFRGGVYGVEKSRFFSDIDIFLFPSHYEAESWGIVVEEALEAGCPIIANRRGCIPWIIRNGCGIIVQPWQSFSDVAAKKICHWLDDMNEFQDACKNALKRAISLKEEADLKVSIFLDTMLLL